MNADFRVYRLGRNRPCALLLAEGNPILGEIMSGRPEVLPNKNALAGTIAARLGDSPVRCPLRAVVFTAHRPAR